MTDQERDDVPMLLRNVELPRFPLRSTSMCIPVRDDEYEEDTFVPHTGPLFIQTPTQMTSSIPITIRDTPDRLPRPSQGKPVSKPHAIMPEETGGNRWSYSGQVPKNEHLLMSGPLGQCDNPDCVNCPPACKNKRHFHRGLNALDNKLHNTIYGHVGGWKKKYRENSVKHSNYEPTCKGRSAVESILCDIMPDCHFHRSIVLPVISRAGNSAMEGH